MGEYEPLTDTDSVTQKLRAAVQKPDGITDQVLFESFLDGHINTPTAFKRPPL